MYIGYNVHWNKFQDNQSSQIHMNMNNLSMNPVIELDNQ